MKYQRLTFRTLDGSKRSAWVERINPPNPGSGINRYGFIWFRKVNVFGGVTFPIEIIGVTTNDIITLKNATLNLKYGTLEVV